MKLRAPAVKGSPNEKQLPSRLKRAAMSGAIDASKTRTIRDEERMLMFLRHLGGDTGHVKYLFIHYTHWSGHISVARKISSPAVPTAILISPPLKEKTVSSEEEQHDERQKTWHNES